MFTGLPTVEYTSNRRLVGRRFPVKTENRRLHDVAIHNHKTAKDAMAALRAASKTAKHNHAVAKHNHAVAKLAIKERNAAVEERNAAVEERNAAVEALSKVTLNTSNGNKLNKRPLKSLQNRIADLHGAGMTASQRKFNNSFFNVAALHRRK